MLNSRFRHDPPKPSLEWIARPRLLDRLDRRFEVDALVVVAPAGYGKTAALSQAVAADGGDPTRHDRWLQCISADADAEVLGLALARSLGVVVDEGAPVGADVLADALLRFAPDRICLILDDLHLVPEGSSGLALVDDLFSLLPRNAHLLCSSRVTPALHLARGRTAGSVERLDIDDLAFDEGELDLAVGDTVARGTEAVRWPAMAALTGTGAASDTVNYLLKEVADSLGDQRRPALVALSHLKELDDRLARAASFGRYSAGELLSGVPLVQRSPEGTFQLHDLWQQSLAHDTPLDEATIEALHSVAQHLLDDGRHIDAAELFAKAGGRSDVERAALDFASRPLMFVSAAGTRRMAAIAAAALGDHPLVDMLEATVTLVGNEELSAEAYERAARAAAAAADVPTELLAIERALNMHAILDPTAIPDWILERAEAIAALGDGPVPGAFSPGVGPSTVADPTVSTTEPTARTARAIAAVVRSHRHRSAGEPEASAADLDVFLPPTQPWHLVAHAFGVSDLGWPEAVMTPDDLVEASTEAAQAGGHYLAQALWLRGEVSPEIAFELGSQLAEATDNRRIPHLQMSTFGVLCGVALAAGQRDAAHSYRDRTVRLAAATASEPARAFAPLSQATCAVSYGDEDAAVLHLKDLLRVNPPGRWPPRAYLYALPTIYALVPDCRPLLDGCRMGPALTTARDAGAALVALRERDDPQPAASLPWHRPWLLRAHVLPPHLAALAAAAAASGNGGVGAVLAELPDARHHLGAAADLAHKPTAAWAAGHIVTLPARPDYDLHVRLFGAAAIFRGNTPVTDPAWTGRHRVRQILAYLLLHRRVARHRLAEALWPDLPAKQALSNLRVNLSHLQKVLQPSRGADERPWFLQADAEFITTATDGIVLDTDRFDATCQLARSLDEQAHGRRAIAAYQEAVDIYQGDYLEEFPDATWATMERIRLRSLATTARCRLGELLLAVGEPEQAAAHATIALRDEPLHERAGRLLVHALSGQDNRAAAQRAMRDLLDLLADQGLTPEHDTELLASTFLSG